MAKSFVLTEKQRKFCELYVTNYNATKSYMEAFENDNYNTCRANGNRLLKDDKILNYVKKLQDEKIKRYGDVAQLVLDNLIEDIVERDDELKHNASWQKSVDLLQKQLGLQNQKIDANVNTPNIKIIIGDDEDEAETE